MSSKTPLTEREVYEIACRTGISLITRDRSEANALLDNFAKTRDKQACARGDLRAYEERLKDEQYLRVCQMVLQRLLGFPCLIMIGDVETQNPQVGLTIACEGRSLYTSQELARRLTIRIPSRSSPVPVSVITIESVQFEKKRPRLTVDEVKIAALTPALFTLGAAQVEESIDASSEHIVNSRGKVELVLSEDKVPDDVAATVRKDETNNDDIDDIDDDDQIFLSRCARGRSTWLQRHVLDHESVKKTILINFNTNA